MSLPYYGLSPQPLKQWKAFQRTFWGGMGILNRERSLLYDPKTHMKLKSPILPTSWLCPAVLCRGSACGAGARPSDKLHGVFVTGVPQQQKPQASVGASDNPWHVTLCLRKL